VSDASTPATGSTVGALAPDFTLPDQTGTPVHLQDLRGKWVVLYFYPKDNTPGCTAEACSFRDSHEDFVDEGAVVIGVSSDSTESHAGFASKHELPFTLVSDEDGGLRKAYNVKKSLGLLPGRVTYVIDPNGIIRKVFSSQMGATKHHTEALETIRAGAPA
jgi:peroxiredoxin Q/BCP